MRGRLLVLLLALAASLGGPGSALADGNVSSNGNGEPPITLPESANSAIAYNTESGSSLFAFAFDVRRVLGSVVDQTNAAVAWSKCSSCQTTAIAIQIVLVEGSPSTVAPQNAAIAVNESCTLCDTFAAAYQFVIGTNGPVRFTEAGLRELRRIRHEIDSWGDRRLTNAEIRALLPGVLDRIKAVLANELRPARSGGQQQQDEHSSTQTHDAQPNAPPQTTATTETGTVQATATVPADTTTSTPATTGPGTATAPTGTTAPAATTMP